MISFDTCIVQGNVGKFNNETFKNLLFYPILRGMIHVFPDFLSIHPTF